MQLENNHKKFMAQALKEARKGKGYTHPNPTVGAVIVKNGRIIGKGYHKKAGLPHAEVEAVKDAESKGYSVEGSTIYITLEPCSHYGKTPPCTDLIIKKKIKEVVVATTDPNPKVSGKGLERLKKEGIKTVSGVLEEKAKKLNEDFFVFITEKRPFVHLKIAQTLDGRIGTKTGSSKWITGEKARRYAHRLRKEATAVLVGTGTALKDNPSLTVRLYPSKKQPVRILIDKDLKVPVDYNIYDGNAQTVVFTGKNAPAKKIKQLEEKAVKVIKLPLKGGNFSIKDILNSLYQLGVVHLLVEGGKETITAFIQEGIFDKISLFVAPKLIGEDGIPSVGKLGVVDISEALKFKIGSIKRLGDDVYMEVYPEK